MREAHDSCSTALLARPEPRRRIVRTQASDGARDMEKHAAKRCQAWNGGSCRADVPHPPHAPADGCHLFPCCGIRLFDHRVSDDLLSLLTLVSPIVSSRVLIRSCCLISLNKARSTYHDRTSAFTPPLLRGLG